MRCFNILEFSVNVIEAIYLSIFNQFDLQVDYINKINIAMSIYYKQKKVYTEYHSYLSNVERLVKHIRERSR